MLIPKKSKFKKLQRKCSTGIESSKNNCSLFKFAIISQTNGMLTAKTLEAGRRTLTRKFKRSAKVLISVHCSKSITKKPDESRMGKGKGHFSHWVCVIKRGTVLYELDGVNHNLAKEGFVLASSKLGIKTKLFSRS